MAKREQNSTGKIRIMTIGLFFCFVSCGFFYARVIPKTFGAGFRSTPTPKPTQTQKIQTPTKTPPNTKFTDFPHDARRHSRLECGACHKFPSANWKRVRKDGEAFPDVTDYPKHESCLSCHRREFFGSPKPGICSICHTNPGPRGGARFAFPNPREVFDLTPKGKQAVSDFAIFFPHDKHVEIVSENKIPGGAIIDATLSSRRGKTGEESCAVCHQTYQPQGTSDDEYLTKPPEKLGDRFWLKKGTFKTVPISHAVCFTCHSADTGILPAPESCAACHKLAPQLPATDFDARLAASIGDLDRITLLAWRKRSSSGTFRHEFSSHADLECANCHNAAAIDTLDAKTQKVAVKSCDMCHITETSDDGGILNFEIDSRKKDARFECVKCHIALGRMPIPESHLAAVRAAGK